MALDFWFIFSISIVYRLQFEKVLFLFPPSPCMQIAHLEMSDFSIVLSENKLGPFFC